MNSFRTAPQQNGFTLLEVLVATAILGIAISIVLQLFSSDLRAISSSGNYVSAITKTEAKMRELLDDDRLSERSWSEMTNDGYRADISIVEVMKDRTQNLQMSLFEITLTMHWTQGGKARSLTLTTMKAKPKQV
ncbi:MAG: prepilin-type N-terminal cleavage/methylation domain-containing protein [Dissulfurispiraceae bacterium]